LGGGDGGLPVAVGVEEVADAGEAGVDGFGFEGAFFLGLGKGGFELILDSFGVFVSLDIEGAEEFWESFLDGEDDGVAGGEVPGDGGIGEAVGAEVGLDEEGGIVRAEAGGGALADVVKATGDGFFERFFCVRAQADKFDLGSREGADEGENEEGGKGAHLFEANGEDDEGAGLALVIDLGSEVPLIIDFESGRGVFATGELVGVAEGEFDLV
jgi:hypothetical protein